MMKYFFKSTKKCISIALAAAMVTVLAAESVDKALYVPLTTDASDMTEASGESDSISSKVLDDVFGETTFYRWEEVTRNNFPQDSEEHLSLFFFGNYNDIASMALAPDCIYMGPKSDSVEGVKNKIASTSAWNSYFKDANSISEEDCYYIKCEDRGIGTDRDEVQPSRRSFFTTDDMHGFMVKYIGMGSKYPKYKIRVQSDNGVNYYLEADDSHSQGMLDVETHSNVRDWTFEWWGHPNRGGECWELYHDDGSMNDNEEMIFRGGFLTVADWGHNDDTDARWFIGKKMRFSTVKGDVTIRKDQVLAIGNDQYVSTEGETEESNGCIIPNGETITIEKGGVLSVSGELINNGTIINNGGVILIKDGGCISPFIQGSGVAANGCGTIKCLDGDILIMEGGALYAGMTDTNCQDVPFCLDGASNLINMGVCVYGSCRLGDSAKVEMYETSRTYGDYKPVKSVGSYSYAPTKFGYSSIFYVDPSKGETKQGVYEEFLKEIDKYKKYGCQVLMITEGTYKGKYYAWRAEFASRQFQPATDLLSGYTKYFLENSPQQCPDLNLGGDDFVKRTSGFEDAKYTVRSWAGMYLADESKEWNGSVWKSTGTYEYKSLEDIAGADKYSSVFFDYPFYTRRKVASGIDPDEVADDVYGFRNYDIIIQDLVL